MKMKNQIKLKLKKKKKERPSSGTPNLLQTQREEVSLRVYRAGEKPGVAAGGWC